MFNAHPINAFDAVTVPLRSSNLIEASAGTGKTYSIAILTLRLVLEKQIPIQQVLMVTFTKAAVAELETRIRQFMRNALKVSQGFTITDDAIAQVVQASMQPDAIGAAETERLLREAVLFLDETAILTIHSFCQRVLTEFAFETGQVFGSEILTDLKAILADRVNAFWRKYITTLHQGVLEELIRSKFSRDSIIKVMENALSGKQLFSPGTLPENFLSAAHQQETYARIREFDTSLENSRQEILQYIASNLPAIRATTEKNAHTKRNLLHLLDEPEALLDVIIATSDKKYVQTAYPEILALAVGLAAIEDEKKLFVKLFISQVYALAIQVVGEATERYKQQNNQLGFDDMINKLYEAVVVNSNEKLLDSLRLKYKAAFIDEFQDTDKMQYEIFNRLFAGDSVLFYIGDPKQSIYAWRKADIFTYFKAKEAVTSEFGMNTNYRSSKRFIEGMNQFFSPLPGFDTFYYAGETNTIDYINVAAPAGAGKGELLKDGQADMPITIYESANNEAISEGVAAQIIRLLSVDEYMLETKDGPRKIRPSDIGILVRKNKQAAEIKRLLSKYGIPAVTIDDTKLFQSAEAINILYILAAAIDITASSINKALLSPLTGFTAAAILAMDDELALNRFKAYQQLWEKEGIYVMLSKFNADYKVKQVLLEQTENGERIITNTLQLMELLHKVQTQKQFSPLELANWLKRGIEGMEAEGDEFEQRVESDEEAVKIVTIHKSKGLEYNIVFAPFLDMTAGTDFEFVTFRDGTTGEYLFADAKLLDDERLRLTERQQEQENRRLVYVAVTRAVYKCYINRNTYHKFAASALSPFVNALKENPASLIAFEPAPALPEHFKYSTNVQVLKPAYRVAENFNLSQVNWRKLSYTWLDGGHQPVQRKPTLAKGLGAYDEFVFRLLKRGANTGNLLHYIFERIDFTNSTNWEKLVTESLARFVPDSASEYAPQLPALLHQVIETTIAIAGTSFSLHQLGRSRRLNELEFDFNVDLFSPEMVNKLSSPELPFQLRYAKELEGIMNGKIDLFFEYGGKYFILDWKSNYLGDQPIDYSPDNIRLAMTDSNYHLQYLIYTLAVKKYLSLRVPGFEYARHFGGVIYLFIRGIRKGSNNGMFTCLPKEGLIDELDRLMAGGTIF